MSKIKFKSIVIDNFGKPDSKGEITAHGTATFDSKVNSAGVALQEFSMSYEKEKDHWVRYVGACVKINDTSGAEVTYTATLTLADSSSHYVDKHAMTIMMSVSLD